MLFFFADNVVGFYDLFLSLPLFKSWLGMDVV